MKRVVKIFVTIWLVFLLAYSGAAWAIENCLADYEEAGADNNYHERSSHGSMEGNYSVRPLPMREPTGPIDVIHCRTNHHELYATDQRSNTTISTRSRKGTSLKTPLLVGSISLRESGSIFRNSHFNWFLSSSPPGFVSRHVFLSIFLI